MKARGMATDAGFNESDHPRDGGKFTSGAGNKGTPGPVTGGAKPKAGAKPYAYNKKHFESEQEFKAQAVKEWNQMHPSARKDYRNSFNTFMRKEAGVIGAKLEKDGSLSWPSKGTSTQQQPKKGMMSRIFGG